MAKCVRVAGQGRPVRMSDDDAFQVVERDHGGEYCSKNFFKKWYVPATVGGTREEVRARLVAGALVPIESLARRLQHPKGGHFYERAA